MTRETLRTGARAAGSVMLAALTGLVLLAGSATGAGSLAELEARLERIQDELDATTERIEDLRTREDLARRRIEGIHARRVVLSERISRLQRRAAARADSLYREGAVEMLEVLLAAGDLSEMSERAQLLSAVSVEDAAVFSELSRSKLELGRLAAGLEAKRSELADARSELSGVSADLQAQFEAAQSDYDALERELARRQAQREQRAEALVAETSAPAPPEPTAYSAPISGGLACPVAGPVSFVDSWGAPRDGHTHQGVDMMAAYGTPIVAITSGTITYSAYDGSGGNMIFLTGDDGNAYWYMHNQENLVSGGRVSAGQQIATVGDTGNAVGTPHLHFEYHPGGGAAVNPYPLVASIC